MHQSSRLTCDQESAAPRPGLVGDVTGVLAIALSVQRSDQVAGVVSLVAELSDGEEAGAQLPLVAQEASRMSSQQATGEAEGPAESLTDLCVHRLHHGGDCQRHRDNTARENTTTLPASLQTSTELYRMSVKRYQVCKDQFVWNVSQMSEVESTFKVL